jgi:hypothetical protein
MTMATILTVLGSVVAIKSFIPATSAPAPQAATMSEPATMKIVPAPVIDPKSEIFIGTGDRSAGSWVRP